MARTRCRRAALALLFLPLLAGRAEAIVGGTLVPGSEADAVVVVSYDNGTGVCSGTLIAPSVVLTAGSCLPDPNASLYLVLGGADPFSTALFSIAASAVHRHPAYDDQTLAHDVGVIELASPAPVTPLPWLATDLGVYEPGLSATFLGFGVTNAATQQGFGLRRGGVAPITEKNTDSFAIDASLGQSPCGGDSGGPALPADSVLTDIVIGVASYGDQDCAQYAVFTRTDTNADFLSLYAPEPSTPAEAGAAAMALVLLGGRSATRRHRARWKRSA